MSEVKKIEGKEQLMTPANIVTLVRIVCIPVFVVIILSPWPSLFPEWPAASLWKPIVAAAVFILLSITDTLDGYLARSRGEVTDLGKFMDPLADKILVSAALLALIELDVLPSWIAIIILAREFIVSGIRMVAASKNVVIAASWYGKAKTVFQMFAIIMFIVMDSPLIYNSLPFTHTQIVVFSWLLMIIAVILTIISMLDYFVKSREVLGFKKAASTSVEDPADAPEEAFPTEEDMNALAQDVIAKALKENRTIACAESCTGGMVSAALTTVPGASDALAGSVVSYSNEVKENTLGVSKDTLDQYGAVSEQTAQEMAQGVRERLGVFAAVSITGIAGPGGAVPGKPVGTVWIGIATEDGTEACLSTFKGDRQQVRIQSACTALEMLKNAL